MRRLEPGDRAGDRDGGGADAEHCVEPPEKSTSISSIAARAACRPGNGDEEVEHARAPLARAVDEHEAAAAGPGQRALGTQEATLGGDARVDRVSAGGEHVARPPRR